MPAPAFLDLYPLALLAAGFATANTIVRSIFGKRGQSELLLTERMTVEARNARAERIRLRIYAFLALAAILIGAAIAARDSIAQMGTMQ